MTNEMTNMIERRLMPGRCLARLFLCLSLVSTGVAYAASDVAHLHKLKEALDAMLAREGRTALAQECFDFLPARVELDLSGWAETDIFAH